MRPPTTPGPWQDRHGRRGADGSAPGDPPGSEEKRLEVRRSDFPAPFASRSSPRRTDGPPSQRRTRVAARRPSATGSARSRSGRRSSARLSTGARSREPRCPSSSSVAHGSPSGSGASTGDAGSRRARLSSSLKKWWNAGPAPGWPTPIFPRPASSSTGASTRMGGCRSSPTGAGSGGRDDHRIDRAP